MFNAISVIKILMNTFENVVLHSRVSIFIICEFSLIHSIFTVIMVGTPNLIYLVKFFILINL